MKSPIKNYRIRRGLTQSEFGHLLGLSQTMVSMLESGERKVDPVDCTRYEQLTAGDLSRYILRPDVFGDEPMKDGKKSA